MDATRKWLQIERDLVPLIMKKLYLEFQASFQDTRKPQVCESENLVRHAQGCIYNTF